MLNKKFIKQKMELIQQELIYMEKLAHYSFQEIASDYTKFNTFERLLEKVVVRAIDINEHIIEELSDISIKTPQNYKETFLRLAQFNIYPMDFAENIAKSASIRNALIHDYDDLDLQKIYASVKECLDDYHKYCDYLLKFLEK